MQPSIGPTLRLLTTALFLFCFGTIARAGTVSWDGGGGNGAWETAANWSTDTLPGASDDVVIDVPAELTVTLTAGSVSVRSLRCEEAFQLAGGTLTVTAGASWVHGVLRLTGGELAVLGATASFTASGSATNTGTHLTARNGGQLSLPTLAHLVRSTAGDLVLTADGTNSVVDVPNVTVGGAADYYQLAFRALNGGRVLAPSLSQMNGAIDAVSRRAGSVVDLSGIQGTLRNLTPGFAGLEAWDGGAIQIANVTALDRVTLSLYGDTLVPTAQLQAITGAELYLQRTTNNFPGLTNVFGSHLTLGFGARATLDGVARLGRTNAGSVTLRVDGAGTVLELPNLTEATVEPYYQLEFFARDGGRISLPRLSVIDGGLDAFADDPGSVIDLPGLQGLLRHPKSGSASVEARNGGSVLMPNVTALDRINLLLRDTGFITVTQLTAFTQAKLTLDDATATLPALTDLNSSSLLAEHGARLTLPGVTQLVCTNSATLTLTAQDPGSVLSLPNVSSARVQPFYQLELYAFQGGRVEIPGLSVVQGALDVLADGTNSVVDLSGLSGQLAPNQAGTAYLEVRAGGSVLIPNVTALDQYRLTIRNTGTVNTEQLSAITDSTVTIDNAIGLFPALTDTTGSAFTYLNGGTGVFQPPADLLVTALSAPATIVAGQPATISWEVTNLGTSVTNGTWSDAVYLSADLVPGDDQFLGLVVTSGDLASGASWRRTNTVVFPAQHAGIWYPVVVANQRRTVFEGTNTFNNTNLSATALQIQAPDLVVEALTLTTNTAKLGQSIGLSWRVRNAGTASATGPWADRLMLLSPAGQPNASVILLNKVNPEPLAPGASYTRAETVTLPLLPQLGEGTYSIVAQADSGNATSESVETNNAAGALLAITLPALPDLTLVQVSSPSNALPGQSIALAWAVTNQGNAPADGPWMESVFIAATNAGAPPQFLGEFSFTNELAASAFLYRTQQVLLPSDLRAGPARLQVAVDSQQAVAERSETNNVGMATGLLLVAPALSLQVTPTNITENSLSSSVAALLTRNSDLTVPLTVSLSSSDTNELTAPANVQIPAGQSSATFALALQRDGIFDADARVTITAAAASHAPASAQVSVLNSDAPRLHLSTEASLVVEGATVSATVSHEAGSDLPLTVFLSTPNPRQVTLPASAFLPAGQTSAMFAVVIGDDTSVEPAREATLEVSAPGFIGASASLAITDNDLLEFTLALGTSSVREDAGTSAATATVSRGNPSPRPLAVELENGNPSAIIVPRSISIPAGQSSVTFPIAAIDDLLVNGSRTAEISAFALASDSSQRVAASAPVVLTITDDDSPALRLAPARDIVAEGLATATTLTLSRNGTSSQPLLVSLASSQPTEATVPATAIIPGGETAVTVPLTTVDDQVSDGSKPVEISASAPGYASGTATVVVTDSNQPDLIIAELAGPASAETEAFINVSYRIANQGLTSAASNWQTRVFLSSDPVVGEDALLAEYPFSGTLPVGQSYGQSRQVRAPQAPGDYWLVVQTDTEGQVAELSEGNNTRVSPQPIQIVPAYQATVETDLTTAPAGTPVPLRGTATKSSTGGPAPYVLVNIHVHVRGTKRVLSALSDAAGQFAANFTPLPGEAGLYEIGAAHPGVADAPIQDSFTLFGLRAGKAGPIRLIEQSSVSGQIEIENLGDLLLTGLAATVVSNPPNMTVTTTLAGSTLPGLGKALLGFALTGGQAAPAPALVVLRVTSAEGARADIPIEITVESRQPRLMSYPAELVAGMRVGGQAFVQFDVVNAGGATSAPVHVVLPQVPWMAVVTANPFPPLAPGATNRVTLQLRPAASLALGAYEGTLALNAGTVGLRVPFNFRALSEAKGDLRLTAVDEYTYFAEGSPKVAGAVVAVRDAISDELVATGTTDAAGQFQLNQLQEGYYTVELTADRHSKYRQVHLIVAGQSNEILAFLRRQAVRYTWIVVPTEIGDRTRVTIETVFEAFVPMPVVTVDPPLIDLAEYSAEVTQIDLKVMNHGLIAAKHARLHFGAHPEWSFELLVSELGDIPARSSMTVPLLIRRTGAGASARSARALFAAASSGGGCSVAGSCEYDYECGGNTLAGGFPVPVVNAHASGDCGASGGNMTGGPGSSGGGGGGGLGGLPPGGSQGPSSCEPCFLNLAKAGINCALKFVLSDALKCAKDSYGCASGIESGPTGRTAYTCGKAIINCLKAAGRSIPLTSLLKYPECAYDILTACNGPPGDPGGGGGGGGAAGAVSNLRNSPRPATRSLPRRS